jgi:hypothetical protein
MFLDDSSWTKGEHGDMGWTTPSVMITKAIVGFILIAFLAFIYAMKPVRKKRVVQIPEQ